MLKAIRAFPYRIFFLLTITLASKISLANENKGDLNLASCDHIVKNLYIESTGANKYEAKIKAHHIGRNRAFNLFLGKLNIKISNLDLSLKFLKEIVNIEKILEEEIDDNRYSAVISYKIDEYQFRKFLINYADDNIVNQFDEYVIIPTLKYKKDHNLWNYKAYWHDIFLANICNFENNSLMLLQSDAHYKNIVNKNNIETYSYRDFVEKMPELLFKNILIVTASLSPNYNFNEKLKGTKNKIQNKIKVDFKILSPFADHPHLYSIEYNLPKEGNVKNITSNLIKKIIREYGNPKSYVLENDQKIDQQSKFKSISNNSTAQSEVENLLSEPIIFYFEDYDNVISQVEKIFLKNKEFKYVKIKEDNKNFYRIALYTDLDDESLVEYLYINNISYYVNDNVRYLVYTDL